MADTLSDEVLMTQVREGAGEMLGILFDRYHARLFNYFLRLTGDRALSEDLVQDVFYRILKRRRTYRPGSPFKPWMFQVARNARTDVFRRKRGVEIELEEPMVEPVIPKDELSDRQQTQLLHRALLQLPEDKREVLVLSRFQDMKYGEIAQLLGCEVGTIKTRVHRALQELRHALAKLEERPHLSPRTGNAYEM
jgi:RNA polymerase sigma-70 factor (ECF subfamily)